ncbi:MAG: hypothetical protein QOG43_2508 [Actinomycetota bacterium]|nr:hypothetical protein [Actinomycetota bacterium]
MRLLWALRRARRLTGEDRRELVVALSVAAFVEIGVRTLPLPRMARLLGIRLDTDGTVPTGSGPIEMPMWAVPRIRAVRRVSGRWPTSTCLRSSLLLGQRLRALDPCLRIGVRREAGGLKAHSWLEVGGVSLDATAKDYSPLAAGRPGSPE